MDGKKGGDGNDRDINESDIVEFKKRIDSSVDSSQSKKDKSVKKQTYKIKPNISQAWVDRLRKEISVIARDND